MNPIFDLIVIGLMMAIILVNLYFPREQSETFMPYVSGLREKKSVFPSVEQ